MPPVNDYSEYRCPPLRDVLHLRDHGETHRTRIGRPDIRPFCGAGRAQMAGIDVKPDVAIDTKDRAEVEALLYDHQLSHPIRELIAY